MKKPHKYKNIGYAVAIFFYIDLSLAAVAYVGSAMITNHQIKSDAAEVLNTPDLSTGLEELELAVQMDLTDMEKSFKQS